MLAINNTRLTSSTLGSHQPSKRTIFLDKLRSFARPSQHINLSLTSARASTSSAPALTPFWTPRFKDVYDRLWSPIATDCVDLLSTSSNASLKNAEPACRYLTELAGPKNLHLNLQKTSLQSLRFSQPDTMEPESIVPMIEQKAKSQRDENSESKQRKEEEELLKYCRKIRIYPTKRQKTLFNKCLGASRFFYNRANSIVRDALTKKNYKILKLERLRPLVMQSDANIPDDHPMAWQKEVPYDTRQEAISELITAYKSNLTKIKSGQVTHFEVGWKSKKKCASQTCRINRKALNATERTIFVSRLNNPKAAKVADKNKTARLRMHKRDHKKFLEDGTLDGNFTLQKTKSGNWYICLPRTRPPSGNKRFPVFENAVYKSVFLDPGARTFQTFYSPDGICGKLGHGFKDSELVPLQTKHDRLQRVQGTVTSKTKSRLRQRCAKLRDKMRHKVDDMHWQTCRFLCDTFRCIFLPKYEVSQMVKGSPLGSKVTRAILSLSQGRFRERLLYHARARGREVIIVDECYTTKTCGSCGLLNDVGSAKVYRCHGCGWHIDRDHNGARNICLKSLTHILSSL
jgi:putative transposase